MEAQQWLDNTFPNDGITFGVRPFVNADRAVFLALFGEAINNALRNGTSIYDALVAEDAGVRGWTQHFDYWKSQGIIS